MSESSNEFFARSVRRSSDCRPSWSLKLAICSMLAGLVGTTGYTMAADDGAAPDKTENRLGAESSPYLLLHAHNPVDWYPWGPEAFEKAKKEGKPIFLSVGYSSCYWCHVMERKVFSNEEIAKYMNEHFVNIKVDREERPDVDDIYMTSLLVYNQLIGSPRGGGWPLSVFLTPDGNPIAGATYLPPEDSPQIGLGFPSVAKRIKTLWADRRDELSHSAGLIAAQVQRMTKPGVELQTVELADTLLTAAVDQVEEMYDPVWGGVDFNAERPDGPRFPNVPRLEMTLDVYESTGDEKLLQIVEHSLTAMARGGIRDHLAGGFHRYSTDRRWHVPHFEKMMYDQAMLLGVYTRAASLTDNPAFHQVATEIADFVQREMTTKDGAFCSALDAETNAIEGEYYVWSKDEVDSVLGSKDAEMLQRVYGMNEENPFEHGFVLHLPKKLSDTAKELGSTPEELTAQLKPLREKLLAKRDERKRPLLDDKVLTSWNALMIRALAISGRELKRPQDLEAASRAADFLLANLRDSEGQLLRTWRHGKAKYQGYLDDYAFLVDALLELHQSTNEKKWMKEAELLAKTQNELFYDDSLQAFYFTASNHEKLIARTSSVYDSVFPSANSVSIRNLLRIGSVNNASKLREIATATLTRFAPTLQKSPASCAGLARALHLWLAQNKEARDLKSTGGILRRPNYVPTVLQVKERSLSGENDTPEAVDSFAFKPVLDDKAAQDGKKDDEKLVKAKVFPFYNALERGGKCLIAVELEIKKGWHINANPPQPDYSVPTKLEVKTTQKVKLTKIRYPKHHELKVVDTDELSHVYDGKVMIYALLEIDEGEAAKAADLKFHIRYQGCNSTACLPPASIIIPAKMNVVDKGAPLKKVNESKFPKPKPPAKQPGSGRSDSSSGNPPE